ncbi:tryptophan synthase subunit beta [Profundibacterium mesophilum]|uniref:Tryptophan synthase subunit beta n=1 Tax=Profundibacterium mesophilum KAUST100406-0324 TaxID=1037889 RepID=A0A921TDE5_9RHOB|nr:tryptophan synthase subunit beta [Profundibacterium mesophilum]KAF0676261.1 hypothetical protein PMES_01418 [Profundibacterium mesophilum KAUST100406-0324]
MTADHPPKAAPGQGPGGRGIGGRFARRSPADREKARLRRQIDAFSSSDPRLRRIIEPVLRDRARWLRIPLAGLLVLGSFAAILPVFGLWMFPLGFLLLAIDLPALRPAVNASLIYGRRRQRALLRWWRAKRGQQDP